MPEDFGALVAPRLQAVASVASVLVKVGSDIPPPFGSAEAVYVVVAPDAISQPSVRHLVTAVLEAAGPAEWWQLRFLGTAGAWFSAESPAPDEAQIMVDAAFATDRTTFQSYRWDGSGWVKVESLVGVQELTPGRIVLTFNPGIDAVSRTPVSADELAALFGDAAVVGSPSRQPARGGMGGGGPAPISFELTLALAGLFTTFFGGLAAAAGKDAWEAIKKGVSALRVHSNRGIAEARLSIAIETGPKQWLILSSGRPGRPLSSVAIQSFETTLVPQLPEGPEVWYADWDEQSQQWLLILPRRPPSATKVRYLGSDLHRRAEAATRKSADSSRVPGSSIGTVREAWSSGNQRRCCRESHLINSKGTGRITPSLSLLPRRLWPDYFVAPVSSSS